MTQDNNRARTWAYFHDHRRVLMHMPSALCSHFQLFAFCGRTRSRSRADAYRVPTGWMGGLVIARAHCHFRLSEAGAHVCDVHAPAFRQQWRKFSGPEGCFGMYSWGTGAKSGAAGAPELFHPVPQCPHRPGQRKPFSLATRYFFTVFHGLYRHVSPSDGPS